VSTSPARLFAAIVSRDGAAAVIHGPSGAGKSAVLANLERRAAAAGWRTHRASRDATERYVPYAAVRALLDPAPALLDVATRPIAETALSLYWHCAGLTRQSPIALFVDDAQWADRASLKVLAQLARRTSKLQLLIVLATRPPGDDADPDVPAVFGALPGVESVCLQSRAA
jgi:hypothetical protein